MRFLKTLVAAICLASVASAAHAFEYTTTMKTKAISQENIKKAMDVFSTECAPLMTKYTSDIVSIEVTTFDEYARYREEDYGWNKHIEVSIKLRDKLSVIPSSHNAAMHTVHYYLGSGSKPGFIAVKRQSQTLCGLKEGEGGRVVFKSVPAMAVIDGK